MRCQGVRYAKWAAVSTVLRTAGIPQWRPTEAARPASVLDRMRRVSRTPASRKSPIPPGTFAGHAEAERNRQGDQPVAASGSGALDASMDPSLDLSPSGSREVGSEVVSDGRSLRAQRLRHERRTQILEVARQLFAQRGYHATSIQDLLDGADIARGTFYLHFDSKRAIFDELVDEFLGRIRSVVRVVDLAPQAPPPLLQIQANLDRVFAVLQQNRDVTRITLLSAEGLDAECDAKMADFYGQVRELLCHALKLGQKMGIVRACDASIVAQAALGGLKEVALLWIARRDTSDEELRRVGHEILSYSLHGLYLPPPVAASGSSLSSSGPAS